MNENKLPELKKISLLYHPKSHEKNPEKHAFQNGDGVFFLNPSQLRHLLFAPPLVSPPGCSENAQDVAMALEQAVLSAAHASEVQNFCGF